MNNEADIMYNNGKKKIIFSTPNIFTNSQCIFIEYNDIIRSPGFNLLYGYLHNGYEEASKIFDLSELKDLDLNSLYNFYSNSLYRNILYELKFTDAFTNLLKEQGIDENYIDSFKDNMYEKALSSVESLYDRYYLQFSDSLHALIRSGFVKRYIIYNETDNRFIRNDISDTFGGVDFAYGDLHDIFKTLPRDTTYVFSDVKKVKILNECGMMEYSSILLGDRYEYNYDDEDNYVIPIEIFEDKIYKFNTFDATILYDSDDEIKPLYDFWNNTNNSI